MESQLPIFVILVPLFTAFAACLLGIAHPKFTLPTVIGGLFMLVFATLGTLLKVLESGTLRYGLGNWPRPVGIEFVVDELNAMLLFLIAIAALFGTVHSIPVVRRDLDEQQVPFYTLLMLLITGLLGMTITGDIFNIYVMIEITALSTYALVALAGGRAYMAAFQYIIIGSIGAGFYLLGVGFIYIKTGSLNIAHLHTILPSLYDSTAILVGFGLILTGLFIKMAMFPLHGWLPNAYSTSLGPVSSIAAPLATKVMLYVMLRIMISVFDPHFTFEILGISTFLVTLSAVAIVAGGVYALAQTDIKRMLTYIIIAEIGYMVGGIWLGNHSGMVGAVFHIINDVLAMLCLFMVVSSIEFKTGGQSRWHLKRLFAKMPFTMTAFCIGCFTLIGIPPTSGFVSKWYLITGGIEAGQFAFPAALIAASLINAILVFRMIEISHCHMERAMTPESLEDIEMDEAPLVMVVPTLIVASLLLVVGLSSQTIINRLILPIIPL